MKFKVEMRVPTEVDLILGDRVTTQTCYGERTGRITKIAFTNDHPEGYVVVGCCGWYPLKSYGKTWWKV